MRNHTITNHIELPIPFSVFSKVKQHVEEEFSTLTDKQRHRFSTRLIELWFFIFEEHRKFAQYHEDKAPQARSWHTNIKAKSLESRFNIRIQGTLFSYAKLRGILEKLDLITTNHKYSSGNFTKSYKPSDSIQWGEYSYLTLRVFVFRDVKPMSKMIEEHSKEYHRLIGDMFKCKLKLKPLFKWIDDNRGKVYTPRRDKYNKPIIMTDDKAYAFMIGAIKFNLGILYYSVADTGRVTSSAVTLPTFMLPYLRMDGKPLVEIDAKNSQPLLMSSILHDNEKYRDAVESGQFYEILARSIQEIRKIQGKKVTRDEAKIYAFTRIFFSNKKMKGITANIVDHAFGDGTSDQINQYLGESEEDNDQLWFKLQSLEADIWIDSVATKSPYPVLTRHDSILCFPQHVDHFKESLVQEYRKRDIQVCLELTEFFEDGRTEETELETEKWRG